MIIRFIRSSLFNLLFFIVTAFCCIAFLPGLLLPRRQFLIVVRIYLHIIQALEVTILGLRYEVRGQENVTQNQTGGMLIAAKHMSTYETLKLHFLFHDPAIILKKELLWLPLWGLYLCKSDVIAIDRSSPEKARQSIDDGAKRMQAQNRPIVIFPQGTRVSPHTTTAQKPYKRGIYHIQQTTNLPIIPLATNSGYFAPKRSWIKRGGRVVFEFMPSIDAGLEKAELMKSLEDKLETRSAFLVEDAKEKALRSKSSWGQALVFICVIVVALACVYTYAWHALERRIKQDYVQLKNTYGITGDGLDIKGYPGPLRLSAHEQAVSIPAVGSISAEDIKGIIWPIPLIPITLKIDDIEYAPRDNGDDVDLGFENFKIHFTPRSADRFYIHGATISHGDFTLQGRGMIDRASADHMVDMTVEAINHHQLLDTLIDKKYLHKNTAIFIRAGLNRLQNDDGIINTQLYQKNQTLYAGSVPLIRLPKATSQ